MARAGADKALKLIKNLPRVTLGTLKPLPGTRGSVCPIFVLFLSNLNQRRGGRPCSVCVSHGTEVLLVVLLMADLAEIVVDLFKMKGPL